MSALDAFREKATDLTQAAAFAFVLGGCAQEAPPTQPTPQPKLEAPAPPTPPSPTDPDLSLGEEKAICQWRAQATNDTANECFKHGHDTGCFARHSPDETQRQCENAMAKRTDDRGELRDRTEVEIVCFLRTGVGEAMTKSVEQPPAQKTRQQCMAALLQKR